MRPTHASHLERWLGRSEVEQISRDVRGWYGPPIALHNVPGAVYATGGGDFIGKIRAGGEATFFDRIESFVRRVNRSSRICARAHRLQMNAGFTSLSDLIAEATAGKKQDFFYQKAGTVGVANVAQTLWRVGNQPAGGTAGPAAPGGRAPVDSDTGGHPFTNPTGGDTLHFVNGYAQSTQLRSLLLYDRIFDVAKTMSSTATESVTGVPTRYQGSTAGAPDYPAGNFVFIEVVTALGATAHNWTVCQYRNQAGTDNQTLPSVTGAASAIQDRFDMPVNQWFCPLATGDTGVKDLAQMQCSASVTGAINFVIGHPIAFMPCVAADVMWQVDGINTAFNLTRIFDDACLALIEMPRGTTTATTYNLAFSAVAG